MNTYTEIVVAWGRQQLAEDLGVPPERVRGWERFDKIPSSNWRRMVDLAPTRGVNISPDLLLNIAAKA